MSILSASCFDRKYLKKLGRRLWSRVQRDTDNGCWEWSGSKTSGYGNIGIKLNGEHCVVLVHRLVFALKNGPIDSDVSICHRCDNPRCCKPSHLFVGTHKENMQDMAAKGRHWASAKPELMKRGEERAFAKLTPEDVAEIRRSRLPQSQIARQYGIGQSTVSRIRTGKKWKHIA